MWPFRSLGPDIPTRQLDRPNHDQVLRAADMLMTDADSDSGKQNDGLLTSERTQPGWEYHAQGKIKRTSSK